MNDKLEREAISRKQERMIFLSIIALIIVGVGFYILSNKPATDAAHSQQTAANKNAAANRAAQKPAAGTPVEEGSAWSIRCNKDEKGNETPELGCEAFQTLVVQETGQRFLEVAVSYPKEVKEGMDPDTANGVLLLPHGILLERPVAFRMEPKEGSEEGAKALTFNMRYCDANGCFGFFDLSPDVVKQLQAAENVQLLFHRLNGELLSVGLAIDGLDTALAKLHEK